MGAPRTLFRKPNPFTDNGELSRGVIQARYTVDPDTAADAVCDSRASRTATQNETCCAPPFEMCMNLPLQQVFASRFCLTDSLTVWPGPNQLAMYTTWCGTRALDLRNATKKSRGTLRDLLVQLA